MHGEYKTPGGKMVVADFHVCDGRLTDVKISGDFFLYPDEALVAITAALTGVRADATDFSERIHRALPPDAELLGFSPEAVAEAVRRGLAG